MPFVHCNYNLNVPHPELISTASLIGNVVTEIIENNTIEVLINLNMLILIKNDEGERNDMIFLQLWKLNSIFIHFMNIIMNMSSFK